MDYFNYFIKCIIRKFVNFICKPKVAFIIILCTFIYFGLRSCGYCSSPVDYNLTSPVPVVYANISPLNNSSGYKSYSTSPPYNIGIVRLSADNGNTNFKFKAGYTYTLTYTGKGSSLGFGYISLTSISNNSVYLFYIGAINKNSPLTFTIPSDYNTSGIGTNLWVRDPAGASGSWTFTLREQYLDEQLTDINNSIQAGNDKLDDINDSITDSSISSDFNLPESSTNDITASGFDSIFETIKNAFTTKNSKPLVINIPFTDKTFTIDSDTVYDGLNFGSLTNIINAFWYFVISLFIAKDILYKIQKLKSGDIESVETNNIKGDLL